MRICVVTNRTENVRWFREDLVRELASRGHDVLVLGEASQEAWNSYFHELGARYKSYPVKRSGLNPFSELATLHALSRLFKSEKPDVVFTYQAKANVYGCLAAANAGIERIFASVEGLGTLSDASNMKKRAVNLALRSLYKPALSAAEAVFFMNPEDVNYFVSRGLVDSERIVMTNGVGVNLEKFSFSPIPKGEPVFLFVGRLVAAKGIREYVRAARLLSEMGVKAECHILGGMDTSSDAISEEELRSWIEEGYVFYDGSVSDVRPYLQRCTALCSPSSYGEGVPKSAMEAMATGRPVVASDIAGFRIVVDDGKTGLLIKSNDSQSLVAAMRKLACDQDLAKEMGINARRKAERQFNVNDVNSVIIEIMQV